MFLLLVVRGIRVLGDERWGRERVVFGHPWRQHLFVHYNQLLKNSRASCSYICTYVYIKYVRLQIFPPA